MKSIRLIAFILTFALCAAAPAGAADVTLAWDPNSPAPDGYRLFQKLDGAVYDYSAPVIPQGMTSADIPPTVNQVIIPGLGPAMPAMQAPGNLVASWNSSASEITLSWSQPQAWAGQIYHWVVRAFVGTVESGDSNEVDETIQTEHVIDHWEISYAMASGGPWALLDSLQNNSGAPTITAPLTAVLPGDIQTVYFKVTAFDASGAASPDSPEISLLIDRRVPVPPQNLRKVATIPVN